MSILAQTSSSDLGWLVATYQAAGTALITTCGIMIAGSLGVVALVFAKLKDVYESDAYAEIMHPMRVINPDLHPNSPLRNFTALACLTALAAAVAIALHLTLGRTNDFNAVLACVIVQGVAVTMFIVELVALLKNVMAMLRFSGRITEEKIAKRETDRKAGRLGVT